MFTKTEYSLLFLLNTVHWQKFAKEKSYIIGRSRLVQHKNWEGNKLNPATGPSEAHLSLTSDILFL